MESILTSIKKMLGIDKDYIHFDADIIMYINTALMTLNQLGVGPDKTASISSELDTWSGTLGEIGDIEAVKTYIYLSVRVIFDPPASSTVLDAIDRKIGELEWRLMTRVELKKEE